ncbi:Ca2+ regulator and membrane fusion protein Fig1-domain-containing protein [Nemania sp. FL0031]|nr:Ca2+ regulator and membrane fusion protein Fig1-domain-containing protein [Nemania sp. FL0031]
MSDIFLATRHAISNKRFTPYVGYNNVFEILSIIPIVLWSFLLAGCTSSNGLRDVYILALSYKGSPSTPNPLLININTTKVLETQVQQSHNTVQEVRVGYLSTCIVFNSGVWSCSANPHELATSIRGEDNGDPLNLLSLGDVVRTRTLFYGLIIISLVFVFVTICLLHSFPGWREGVDSDGSERMFKPLPPRKVIYSALGLSLVASLLGFASAFWQHIGAANASSVARALTYNLVAARVGTTSSVLAWAAAAVSAIVAMGILTLVHAMSTLTLLAEQADS